MASPAQPPAYPARTVGPIARRLLAGRGEGRVAAAFRSAFYVAFGRRLLCIGSSAIEPGPLNLVASAPARLDWRARGVRLNDHVAVSGSEVRVAGILRFPLANAAHWSPDPPAGAIDAAAVARGLAALREAYSGCAVAEGIGRFIVRSYVPGPRERECLAAAIPISNARQWLICAFSQSDAAGRGASDWVGRLAGLGPGVTPSGDDFLGGMMIALDSLGFPAVRRVLWGTVRPHAEGQGNAISLALLRAASEGMGSASVHKALAGILRGDIAAVRQAVPGIGRIGHSSGWDAMAGAAAVLEGWLAAQRAAVA